MKEHLGFLLKAFVGGCVGCLGAWVTTLIVLGIVLGITVGVAGPVISKAASSLMQDATSSLLPDFSGAGGLPGLPTGQDFSDLLPDQGLPGMTLPTQDVNCAATIQAWVSNEEFGEPATAFSVRDGIYPVVSGTLPCDQVKAQLLDENDQVLVEKSYNVVIGPTGYGDYNPEKNLATGSYRMQFWMGDTLIKEIGLVVE